MHKAPLAILESVQSTSVRELEKAHTKPNTLACKKCYRTRAFCFLPCYYVPAIL